MVLCLPLVDHAASIVDQNIQSFILFFELFGKLDNILGLAHVKNMRMYVSIITQLCQLLLGFCPILRIPKIKIVKDKMKDD